MPEDVRTAGRLHRIWLSSAAALAALLAAPRAGGACASCHRRRNGLALCGEAHSSIASRRAAPYSGVPWKEARPFVRLAFCHAPLARVKGRSLASHVRISFQLQPTPQLHHSCVTSLAGAPGAAA